MASNIKSKYNYEPTKWTDGSGEPLSETNLNNIEDGIVQVTSACNDLDERVETNTNILKSHSTQIEDCASQQTVNDLKNTLFGSNTSNNNETNLIGQIQDKIDKNSGDISTLGITLVEATTNIKELAKSDTILGTSFEELRNEVTQFTEDTTGKIEEIVKKNLPSPASLFTAGNVVMSWQLSENDKYVEILNEVVKVAQNSDKTYYITVSLEFHDIFEKFVEQYDLSSLSNQFEDLQDNIEKLKIIVDTEMYGDDLVKQWNTSGSYKPDYTQESRIDKLKSQHSDLVQRLRWKNFT